jgi:hypothetical protein
MRPHQAKLDELEYFFDDIGTQLFGPEASDFRRLERHVPRTANLLILLDAAREAEGKDIAADFQFVHGELLRRRSGEASPPEYDPRVCLFNFLPYLDLLERPLAPLDGVEKRYWRGIRQLAEARRGHLLDGLARTNAYAWLALVGLPDLSLESEPARGQRLSLEPGGDRVRRGLQAVFRRLAGGVSASLARYLSRAHYLLSIEYRGQIETLVRERS